MNIFIRYIILGWHLYSFSTLMKDALPSSPGLHHLVEGSPVGLIVVPLKVMCLFFLAACKPLSLSLVL